MLIKDLKDCGEFIAGDRTVLRELLHASKIPNPDFRYSLAHATVKPGAASTPHRLKTSEVYYILEGEGEMHVTSRRNVGIAATTNAAHANGEETVRVHAGQVVVIPPNAKQYIRNMGKTDLKFLCIVDPAWKPEDEVVF